jgi:hypothetical protein
MKIPFRFRKIPKWQFDGDGQYSENRITGKDKRILRKRQIKNYLRDFDDIRNDFF